MNGFIKYLISAMMFMSAPAQGANEDITNRQNTASEFTQIKSTRNFVKNGQFEDSNLGATLSAGSFGDLGNSIKGKRSLYVSTTTGTNQTLKLKLLKGNELIGMTCELSFAYVTGASDVQYKIRDVGNSSDVFAYQTLQSAATVATHKRISYNFPCPQPNAINAEYEIWFLFPTGSTSFALDDVYYGLATNVGQIAQARFVGSISWAQAASCTWTNNSTGSFGSFAADTDCAAPTVIGELSAPSTKIPGFVVNAVPGTYLIVPHFVAFQNVTNAATQFRMTDGTVNSTEATVYCRDGATCGFTPLGEMSMTFTTASAGATVRLQSLSNSSTNIQLDMAQSNQKFGFDVYYFPTSSQTAVQLSQTNFGPVEINGITLTSAGGGVVKGTPTTDKIIYWKEGQFLFARYHYAQTTGGIAGTGEYIFGLPYTADTSIVPAYGSNLGNGDNKDLHKSYIGDGTLGIDSSTRGPVKCYLATSTAFRCVAEGVFSTYSAFGSGFFSMANANMGFEFTIKVPISGWTTNNNIGTITGMVASSGSVVKIDYATANCSSTTSAIASQSGGWSITNGGIAGTCTMNISSSNFSSTPTCNCTMSGQTVVGTSGNSGCQFLSISTTSLSIQRYLNNGFQDGTVNIDCKGPR